MNMHVTHPLAQQVTDHVCTLEEAASLSFEPWVSDPNGEDLPSAKEMTNSLTWIRVAYKMMFLRREDMIVRFATMSEADLEDLFQGLQGTSTLLECMRDITNAARARFLCATSAGALSEQIGPVAQ